MVLCTIWTAAMIYIVTGIIVGLLGFEMPLGFTGLMFALLALPATSVLIPQYKKLLERQEKLYVFARNNHAVYVINQGNPELNGMIFDEGYSRVVTEALLFENGIEAGNYRYLTGHGKHRQVHEWSYVIAPLVRRLPHMVFDAKSNNLFGLSNLPDSFHGQDVSLEGNFDKHFTLYAPEAYDRDVRYVLTPNVMAAIIDLGREFDIEIIDDQLILYTNQFTKLESEPQLRKIMHVVDALSDKINYQSRRYVDERVGDQALNMVAHQGRRLVPNVTVSTVVGVILFLLVLFIISYR